MSGRRAYAALLAGAFLVYASANAPVPVASELRGDLGLAGAGAAIFLLPFAAGFGAGSVLWLAVARRRSARLLLPLALCGAAAASALVVAADSPALVVVARALVGASAAGYPAAAQAVIGRLAHPARRGGMIGGFVAAVVAGSFLGQVITGVAAEVLSVDAAILLLCTAAPLAVAALLSRAVPPEPVAPTATAAALLPAVPRHLLPVLAVAALSFGAYWMMLSELPAALREDRFDLTPAQAGALPAIGLLGVPAALLAGRACDRLGQRAPLVLALAVGLAGLLPTLAAGAPLWLFAAGYGAFLTAYWGYLPPASAEIVARSRPEERQGALMALYAAMWIGAAVAPAASALLDWTGCALLALAAWGLALVPASRFSRRPAAPPAPAPAPGS